MFHPLHNLFDPLHELFHPSIDLLNPFFSLQAQDRRAQDSADVGAIGLALEPF